ncbi:hypothetical protein JIN85_10500 [Luteolibacter pohnpeiensis]|uniref:MBG domain-containing protein n=1 Tax=Luteolibacter pohnpeiensis TaxID=454153 RepID=A0A934VUS6_9BACT|nr:MBG domain-containing protein [Luteolibacter pohnpeiensis]MBK1882847.1 hypothetical protein [Luteolibacter pohnpeiensis]
MSSIRRLLLGWIVLGANLSLAQTPVQLTLSNTTQVYDGTAKLPTVSSDPDGLTVQLSFNDPSTTPTVTTVFQSIPDPVGSAYPSIAFAGNNYSGMGDYVKLAGSARYLDSVETVLSSYAKASSYPQLAAQNPDGYYHTVRLHVFQAASNFGLSYFAEKSQQVLIPWVPEELNSISFKVLFSFPGNLILPNDLALMVSYNTKSTGFNPIGTAGPYDKLNLSVNTTAPTVGTDVYAEGYFYYLQNGTYYLATSSYSPMFKVNASSSPATAIATPVNAGSYEVTATVTSSGYSGQATSSFIILPAPVTLTLGNLTQIADGTPKSVSLSTDPSGISTSVTYDGASQVPSAIGRYQVVATVTNSNYSGSASAELQIGYDYASWIQQSVTAGTIGSDQTADFADPDGDSLPNLLEYAFGLNPGAADYMAPDLDVSSENLSLIYRRNLDATDLTYQIETATDLDSDSWSEAATTDTVLSTEGSIETVEATIPRTEGEPKRFLRLKVTR